MNLGTMFGRDGLGGLLNLPDFAIYANGQVALKNLSGAEFIWSSGVGIENKSTIKLQPGSAAVLAGDGAQWRIISTHGTVTLE